MSILTQHSGWPKGAYLWIFLAVAVIACCCTIFSYPWNVNTLLEQSKCPLCYGDSLCPLLQSDPDLLSVYYFGIFGWIMNSITTKNVFRGRLGSSEVIIKRLGHESELEAMDKLLCSKIPEFCLKEVPLSKETIEFLIEDVETLLSDKLQRERKVNLLRFCPSLKSVPAFLNCVNSINCSKDGWLSDVSRLVNIWTILHINGEPILLQAFPQEEGWPFPKYFGACGRVIVESFEGTPLRCSYHEPWIKRARLAVQLLEAVDRFTLHDPDFALYLLDYSADNIVVDSSQRVSFVDLEHSVIVDKRASSPGNEWDFLHYNGGVCYQDTGCSYFSVDDICQHKISDFNHHMLCKDILAPSREGDVPMPEGFLHSTPAHILQKYPSFEEALKNCSSDSVLNHMAAAELIRDILQKEVGSSSKG